MYPILSTVIEMQVKLSVYTAPRYFWTKRQSRGTSRIATATQKIVPTSLYTIRYLLVAQTHSYKSKNKINYMFSSGDSGR